MTLIRKMTKGFSWINIQLAYSDGPSDYDQSEAERLKFEQ